MQPSAEVRWFLPGPLPDPVLQWFRAVAGEPDWEERTDRYLLPATPDGLGVKLRGGRAEAKRRVAVVGEERFGEGVAGAVERWRKWSFALAEPAEPDGAEWIAVAKRRRVRTFAVEGDAVRSVEGEERVAQGCGVEVAEVRVGDGVWWSVCLEAFGSDEAALPDVLRAVAAHVFDAQREPPGLPSDPAMSYPRWLREYARSPEHR